MKTQIIFLMLFLASIFAKAQVTDYDGNVYDTVNIGGYCWFKQNMKTTHYPNGTAISTSGYMAYNNNSSNKTTYGYLYTFPAALNNDTGIIVQGICPNGYHVSSINDWGNLNNYLVSNQGSKIKDNTAWDGTNTSGFTALPGGNAYNLNSSALFSGIDTNATFWSVPQCGCDFYVSNHFPIANLSTGSNIINFNLSQYYCAFSCRCVKNYSTGMGIRLAAQANITLTPNPSNTTFAIGISNVSFSKLKLELYNSLGNLVYSKEENTKGGSASQYNIDVSQLKNGMYNLNVIIDGQTIIKKIVVQH